jgi:hypothetical protein
MFWQSALSEKVKAVPLYENNQMVDGERYIYYDLATGHMFDIRYKKKE